MTLLNADRHPGRGILAGVFVLLAATVAVPPLEAQVLYGSIVGNVKDSTGGAVPGAAVTATNTETRASRDTVTDGTGAYRFSTLQPGSYTVVVALTGFQSFTRNDVPVTLNTVTRVDASLGVGQLQETVTVSADTEVLQTDRAEVRQELRTRELTDLPVTVGRNYQELFATLPGFSPPADAHSIPSNPSRALTFNVNGASQSSNNTRIDGVSSQNVWLPHVVAYVPALEAIETVNVVTNSFDAEQGLAGGAAISVQIKSGTNQIRGSAFGYHFNEKMRAENYFTPEGTTKGKWVDNQFGGTIGGPIKRNRLFYFLSYEGTRQDRDVPRTESVPTDAIRRGDFRGTGSIIYDPFTGNPNGSGRTPFPNNVIPDDRISEVAKKILSFYPTANLFEADGVTPRETDNYFIQPRFMFNRWTVDSKVNWNASDRLQVFGRYSQLDFYQDNETVLGPQLQGSPGAGGNPGTGWGGTYNFSAGANYTLGNNAVFDAHFGWVRMDSNVAHSDVGENKGLDWLGIPGTNGPFSYEGGMPRFDLDEYADVGTTEDYMPYYRADDQYQTVLNMTWLKGRHNLRFGSDIYFTALNHIQPEIAADGYGARGGFAFDDGPTLLRNGPGGTFYNSFASFLLGLPNDRGRLGLNVAPYTTRSWQYSFYARDQWQVAPRVTLSFGARYEYFPIPTRADRGLERYNLETNMMEIGGLGNVPEDLGVKMQKNLISPRLGVAWRITDTSVLRGGFGITNDPYSLARPMRTNHPILLNLYEEADDSLTWVGRVEDGIPVIPEADLTGGIIPVPGNVTVVTLPDEFNRGRLESWNVAYEQELGFWNLTGEVAYVGNRQVDQLGSREQNWSPIGGGNSGRQLVQKFGRTAPTLLIAPLGNAHYNGLQTRLSRRFVDGFSFNVNYTLSRAIGIAGAPNSDNQPRVRIPDLYHLNTGISDIDRTHVLNIRSIWELPFGPGRRWLNGGGVLPAILGGWQLNNIVFFRSGRPFTVTTSTTPLNAAGSVNQNPADRVKDDAEVLGGIGDGQSWFDPFAFAPVAEARFGNSGFNSMRGPGTKQWDIGLFRQVNLGGQRNLQFRVEAFNVTNTPHFANPGGNRSSLRLNPDGTIRDLNGYTEITDTTGTKSERVVRVGVRFGF